MKTKTDNDIIRAAKICLEGAECLSCPYWHKTKDPENATCDCATQVQKDLLGLVLRMKKQLKRLDKAEVQK